MKTELPGSHICITDQIEAYASTLQEQTRGYRFVSFLKEDFLIDDAKAVIAEAYISEERQKFLVLGAISFNTASQNALLKILEEPPRHIVFIVIAPSKSTLLPTIRSRLPIRNSVKSVQYEPLDFSLKQLELSRLFGFVKEHERLKRHELHHMIERIVHHALYHEKMLLNTQQLEAVERAYRLSQLNGRTLSILVMVLMSFIPERLRVS